MNLVTFVRSGSMATLLLAGLALGAGDARATAVCCVVPDVGGTAAVPPACPSGYQDGQTFSLNGLPPGTPVLGTLSIIQINNGPEVPGGSLGGTAQSNTATLVLHLVGTGPIVYNRVLSFPITLDTEAAPRVPFAPLQSFAMELVQLQGQLAAGDPDFDLLRVTAGLHFGMPSPGHSTLTVAGPGWGVDSFFDITSRLDYVGHPGGPFGGYSNSQTESLQPFDMCHSRTTASRASSWGAVKSIYR